MLSKGRYTQAFVSWLRDSMEKTGNSFLATMYLLHEIAVATYKGEMQAQYLAHPSDSDPIFLR